MFHTPFANMLHNYLGARFTSKKADTWSNSVVPSLNMIVVCVKLSVLFRSESPNTRAFAGRA